jgi:arabinoxylan arabinofuranohydrolase
MAFSFSWVYSCLVCMAQQAFNPFLPAPEYVPDGEPHVFGQRVYLYGSHDGFGAHAFCVGDYVCYSAPLSDLREWRYEGVIFKKNQTPPQFDPRTIYWAPDVARGKDGRYYLYYFVGVAHPNENRLQVAVSEKPEGPYEYLSPVFYASGKAVGDSRQELKNFDPAIFVDDDGRVFLYSGFGAPHDNPFIQHGWHASKQGPFVYELEEDMIHVKKGPYFLGIPSARTGQGTPYEGHEFFEASSLRKFDSTYYFIYSSIQGHELCYAYSSYPDRAFHYGGTLIDIGDVGLEGRKQKDALNYLGNTHGSLLKVGDDYYVFYHRQTNLYQYSRQACAEKIIRDEAGQFHQAGITSCGLNGGPLEGKGTYEARIACHLVGPKGTRFYGIFRLPFLRKKEPYFTQETKNGSTYQYLANLCDGAYCAFRYFSFDKPQKIRLLARGTATGSLHVRLARNGEDVAVVTLEKSRDWGAFEAPLRPIEGKEPLCFVYEGSGHFDWLNFTIF